MRGGRRGTTASPLDGGRDGGRRPSPLLHSSGIFLFVRLLFLLSPRPTIQLLPPPSFCAVLGRKEFGRGVGGGRRTASSSRKRKGRRRKENTSANFPKVYIVTKLEREGEKRPPGTPPPPLFFSSLCYLFSPLSTTFLLLPRAKTEKAIEGRAQNSPFDGKKTREQN